MHPAKILLAVLLLLPGLSDEVSAQNAIDRDAGTRASLVAAPADGSMTIDGRLDEAAWQQAEAASEFYQFEPNEGMPASQNTEVRVLYGPGEVYVGAVLYDDRPDAIEAALGRRDELNRADWFLVSIDSYFDRRTAYTFGVNAAGVQFDAVRTGTGGGPGGDGGPDGGLPGADASWDAVWYSDVRLTPQGWVVEMRIPSTMLRFADEPTRWGIHFTRRIPRLGEEAEWPLVSRTERSNLVANFGHLTGMTDIEPGRNLQLRPYSVARLHSEESLDERGVPSRSGSLDVGGDVKFGLGPNITLDATINPDFGQVESDPAVLNLTAFETFFEERRPFFIEGSQIYQFSVGPGQLLYTRRIGADQPIVGATKLSGRTSNGLSFGVLGATTGDDFDPARYYGVARMSQQIGTYSSAGGILTLLDGSALEEGGRLRSVAGGADWDIRLAGNRYGLEGFASVTHRRSLEAEDASETGAAGKLWARKRQGAWTGFVGLDVFGSTFNPNDVGQLRENNFVALLNQLQYEIEGGQPFGPFLRAGAETFTIQQFSYDEGLNLGLSVDLGTQWMLRSFQQIEVRLSAENPFGGYDLFETRGLGPWAKPFGFEIGGEIETDERRAWQVEPEAALRLNDDGGRTYAVGLRTDWNLGSRLALSGNLEGEWEDDVTAWASNEAFWRGPEGWMIGRESNPGAEADPDAFVAFDDRGQLDAILAEMDPLETNRYLVSIFGARDTRSLDLTLRGTFTFTPDLSLQLYSQLFLARGRYDAFQILQDRDTPLPFAPFPKRNEFAFSSLQSNVVLRWEYLPGSTLFLVWTHGRRADEELNPLAPWERSPYEQGIDDQIADAFGIFPSNVFLIKVNYTFLY